MIFHTHDVGGAPSSPRHHDGPLLFETATKRAPKEEEEFMALSTTYTQTQTNKYTQTHTRIEISHCLTLQTENMLCTQSGLHATHGLQT